MTTEQISLKDFIAKHGITMAVKHIDSRPDGIGSDFGAGARHWLCTLEFKGWKMPVYFSQGSAHREEPKAEEVLNCLASDISSYENADSFKGWAWEFGYDEDSRKAERLYNAIGEQRDDLQRMFTDCEDAYEELLWRTERL